MSPRNPDLQARLEAKAKAVIDDVLGHTKDPAERTLADIEQAARVAGQQVAQALTAELVAESTVQIEPDWRVCPGCGRRLKAKGKHAKRLVTETGEVMLKREYYYCAGCRSGIFPPG